MVGAESFVYAPEESSREMALPETREECVLEEGGEYLGYACDGY